jgi:hypothetical protein
MEDREEEIIIACGVEGGSWTLVGRRGALGISSTRLHVVQAAAW